MTGAAAARGADDVSVVVLAGGRGTRIQALHPTTPKPMIAVRGQPWLHWLTAWFAGQGLSDFIYSTGYRSEQIADWCGNAAFPGLSRRCVAETAPLGTGGALLNSLPGCRDWVLVANGDGLCMAGVGALLALRDRPGADGGLLGVRVEDTARYGSLAIGAGDRLTGFHEKVPGTGHVNGGVYLFRRALLEAHARPGQLSLEHDLFPELIAAGADLRVVRLADSPFIDIGTPETLALADAFIRDHVLGDGPPA